MSAERVPIQRRELDLAMEMQPSGVVRRAAEALALLLDGKTIIVEERIAELPGGEDLIEETVISPAMEELPDAH